MGLLGVNLGSLANLVCLRFPGIKKERWVARGILLGLTRAGSPDSGVEPNVAPRASGWFVR